MQRRLVLRADLRPDTLAPASAAHIESIVQWSFALLCTSLLVREIVFAGSDAVAEAVRVLLAGSGTQAYACLRTLELTLEDKRTGEAAAPSAPTSSLSGELVHLEAEAHAEGERLLRSAEGGS